VRKRDRKLLALSHRERRLGSRICGFWDIKRFDGRVTGTARDLNPRKSRALIALLLIRAYAIFIFATTAERRSCVERETENPHPLGGEPSVETRAPDFTGRFIAIIRTREGEKSADERTGVRLLAR